ncbi:MAG TPA: hypothetical protein VGI70_06555, partial [Polyangiales bacterium]|jgi:hypothetical protein
MPLAHQDKTLTMGFCLDCHRDPQEHVPGHRAEVSDPPIWRSRPGAADRDSQVVANKLITCTACHR